MSDAPPKPDAQPPRPARAPRPDPEGIVFVEAGWNVPQTYRPDPMIVRMFEGFRERRLLGARVRGGERVIFPPQSYCEASYRPTDGLVEVGPGGTIRTFTVARVKWTGPNPPYVVVFVQLDGASTATGGYLRGVDPDEARSLSLIGARCRVVFGEEPVGRWSDIGFALED